MIDAANSGGDALDPLAAAIEALGIDLQGFELGKLDNLANDQAVAVVNEIAEALGTEYDVIRDLINITEDFDQQTRESNETALRRLRLTEELTKAQFDDAVAAGTSARGNIDWAKALEFASNELGVTAAEARDLLGTTGDYGDAASGAVGPTDDMGDELLSLSRAARDASGELIDTKDKLKEYTDAVIGAYEAELSFSDAADSLRDANQTVTEALEERNRVAGPEGDLRRRIATLELVEAQQELSDAYKTGSQSALSIAQAELSVIDARQSAGDIADATREAEERLYDARIAAREAQEALEDFQGEEGENRLRIMRLRLEEARKELAALRRQGGAESVAEAEAILEQARRDAARVSDEDPNSRRRRLSDKRVIDAENNLRRVREQQGASALDLAEAQQQVFDAEDSLRDFHQAAEAAEISRARAARGLADAEQDLGDTLETQAQRQRVANLQVADAQQKLAQSYETTRGSALEITQAQLGVFEAQQNVRDTAGETARAEEDLRDATRDAEDAVFDLAQEAYDLAIATGGDAYDGLVAMNRVLEFFHQEVREGNPARDNLIRDLQDIEGDYHADIQVNTSQARAEIERWKIELRGNPPTIPVLLDPVGWGPGARGVRVSQGGGGIPFGAAQGFYGTLDSPTRFVLGDAPEDALVVPTSLGGIDRVVADLAARIQPTTGTGVVFEEGAIQVVAGPDSSPQAIASEVVDRLAYELTVRADA